MSSDKAGKKLRLHKETLVNLSDASLSQVAGGNGDSAGIICVFSILIICGDSIICSVLAGACENDNGDSSGGSSSNSGLR
ncbi:class I lanthipeptide [Melittangium boletus]|nr:class I lanthipeptide [Melittangium boletus]